MGAVVGGAARQCAWRQHRAGTVGGAAHGALIGNEVGRRSDQRNNSYYPNNGPRY